MTNRIDGEVAHTRSWSKYQMDTNWLQINTNRCHTVQVAHGGMPKSHATLRLLMWSHLVSNSLRYRSNNQQQDTNALYACFRIQARNA